MFQTTSLHNFYVQWDLYVCLLQKADVIIDYNLDSVGKDRGENRGRKRNREIISL